MSVNVSAVIQQLDNELGAATATGDSFGVKLGEGLFFHLRDVGRLTMVPTQVKEMPFWKCGDFPAIDKQHLTTLDWTFGGWDFHVGGRARVNA